jgi:hypothetical protein
LSGSDEPLYGNLNRRTDRTQIQPRGHIVWPGPEYMEYMVRKLSGRYARQALLSGGSQEAAPWSGGQISLQTQWQTQARPSMAGPAECNELIE